MNSTIRQDNLFVVRDAIKDSLTLAEDLDYEMFTCQELTETVDQCVELIEVVSGQRRYLANTLKNLHLLHDEEQWADILDIKLPVLDTSQPLWQIWMGDHLMMRNSSAWHILTNTFPRLLSQVETLLQIPTRPE